MDAIFVVADLIMVAINPSAENLAALGADFGAMFIPFATGAGAGVHIGFAVARTADNFIDVGKGIDKLVDVGKVAEKGWSVGKPIDTLTKAGKVPSWSTVRQRHWKNEAFYNSKKYSIDNLKAMRKGAPPIVKGQKMVLHHPLGRQGKNFFNFFPMGELRHINWHKINGHPWI